MSVYILVWILFMYYLLSIYLVEKCLADSMTESDSDEMIICTDDSDMEPYFITDDSDVESDGESHPNVQVIW